MAGDGIRVISKLRDIVFLSRAKRSTVERARAWRSLRHQEVPLLWIRSMIAKLPGGGTFMGSHLEVICLLQAAEIERLTDFLDIYKFRYRQNYSDSRTYREMNSTGIHTRFKSKNFLRKLQIWMCFELTIKN